MSVLSGLLRDVRGRAAVTFALTIVPIVSAIAIAIDGSHVVQVRSRLAHALDAGVLAVVRESKLSDAQALMIVRRSVDRQMPHADATWSVDFVAQSSDGTVVGRASGQVQTTIARILGIDAVPISVTSQATRAPDKADASLAPPPPLPG